MANFKIQKDYTNRDQVKKYLEYWKQFLFDHGEDETKRYLTTVGMTKMLKAKDRKGLIQALKLEDV
jgi:hypothetical protein